MWRPPCVTFPTCMDDREAGIHYYALFFGCSGKDNLQFVANIEASTNIFSTSELGGFGMVDGATCWWRVDTYVLGTPEAPCEHSTIDDIPKGWGWEEGDGNANWWAGEILNFFETPYR